MTDDANVVLSKLIGEKFVQRRDVKARQQKDGSWRPVRSKWTKEDMASHLSGKASYGHYMTDPDNICKLFAYDIDARQGEDGFDKNGDENGAVETMMFAPDGELVPVDPRAIWMGAVSKQNLAAEAAGADPVFVDGLNEHAEFYRKQLQRELRAIGEGLAYRVHRMTGFPVAVMASGGKGLHVYCFTGPQPSDEIREVAHGILLNGSETPGAGMWNYSKGKNFFMHDWAFDNWEVEVFPKQDTMEGKDLGNLMSLPLGKNSRSGRPRQFLTFPEDFNARPRPMDPVEALSGVLPWEASPANIVAADLYAHAAQVTDSRSPLSESAPEASSSVPNEAGSTKPPKSTPTAVPTKRKSKSRNSDQPTFV